MISIIGPWRRSDALTLVYLGLVVALAAMTYRWLELPGQTLFHRLEGRRRWRAAKA